MTDTGLGGLIGPRARAAGSTVEVGVIGSINLDTIHHPDGRRSESLGGILFTACALAHLGRGRLRTRLFARLPKELESRVAPLLRGCPATALDGLMGHDGPGYRCEIRYDRSGHKSERLRGDLPPLESAELARWMSTLDALLVNFITGFEIDLETLRSLRPRLRGPVLMDVHSLTLERDAEGRRRLRAPSSWPRWASLADVIQMNEVEARTLGAPADGLGDWAASLLDLGPKVAVITLGEQGVLSAWRTPRGGVRGVRLPAAPAAEGLPVDPTGCGDVFLAAMAVGLLTGWTVEQALRQATLAAARNCTLTGIDDLFLLAEEEL